MYRSNALAGKFCACSLTTAYILPFLHVFFPFHNQTRRTLFIHISARATRASDRPFPTAGRLTRTRLCMGTNILYSAKKNYFHHFSFAARVGAVLVFCYFFGFIYHSWFYTDLISVASHEYLQKFQYSYPFLRRERKTCR